ncbi:MAG: LCP family protein [Actinopolymorphaceae bacterium]
MADRPRNPDDRGYDWLYGENRDEEATQRVPTSRRFGDRDGAWGSHRDLRTRAMPVGGRSERPGYEHRARPTGPPPPPPRGRRSGGGRRPRTRPRRGRLVLLVLLAWLLFLIAVPVYAMSTIDKVKAEPKGDRPDNTLGSVSLLVGSDSREGLTANERRKLHTGNAGGERTDTILLLYEPPFGGGKTLLVSLPRDSIVDVPGVGTTKINSAYAYGGPKLLVETVEGETGLYIDNYIEIGLGGFVNLVDAVDGVRICPKQRMDDVKAGLHIKKGCQDADGVTALGYARSRHTYSTGDIGRGEAQREVIGQVAHKAASPWSMINPFRYIALNTGGADTLRVGENVGPIDMAQFAWAVRKVSGKSKDGKTCTVPIADLSVNWDTDRARALFETMQEGDTNHVSKRLCSKTGLPY